MKKIWNKYKGAIIVIVLLGLFVLLSLLTEAGSKKNPKDEIKLEKLTEEVRAWVDETEKDKYVVNVLSQTTCTYCMSYKPVMTAVQQAYGFELYWWEVNEIYNDPERTEDYKALTVYYGLEDYTGTPHTYITKNGELIVEQGGAMTENEELIDFLKSYGVITE